MIILGIEQDRSTWNSHDKPNMIGHAWMGSKYYEVEMVPVIVHCERYAMKQEHRKSVAWSHMLALM